MLNVQLGISDVVACTSLPNIGFLVLKRVAVVAVVVFSCFFPQISFLYYEIVFKVQGICQCAIYPFPSLFDLGWWWQASRCPINGRVDLIQSITRSHHCFDRQKVPRFEFQYFQGHGLRIFQPAHETVEFREQCKWLQEGWVLCAKSLEHLLGFLPARRITDPSCCLVQEFFVFSAAPRLRTPKHAELPDRIVSLLQLFQQGPLLSAVLLLFDGTQYL
mmetsp:Transcript_11874/g.34054  ORF Transcript_11874/g.34054 Transcript_11874/m.34054 type:complete len:218 (-) Transcript_11874:487-1140(-)